MGNEGFEKQSAGPTLHTYVSVGHCLSYSVHLSSFQNLAPTLPTMQLKQCRGTTGGRLSKLLDFFQIGSSAQNLKACFNV